MGEAGLDGGCECLWEGLRVGWRDLGQGSRVNLRLFYPRFSTDSQLLGENKVIRNPHMFIERDLGNDNLHHHLISFPENSIRTVTKE